MSVIANNIERLEYFIRPVFKCDGCGVCHQGDRLTAYVYTRDKLDEALNNMSAKAYAMPNGWASEYYQPKDKHYCEGCK